MYVRWIRRVLPDQTASRKDVPCVHQGPGRGVLLPQVLESYRDPQGVARVRLVWTPAGGIRTCCVDDADDPIARAQWWREVYAGMAALKARRRDPVAGRVLAALPALVRSFGTLVPRVTEAEGRVVAAWNATATRPRVRETLRAWHVRRLTAARAQAGGGGLTVAEACAALGLSAMPTADQLKAAYKATAFRVHPDRTKGPAAAFRRTTDAYTLLKAKLPK